MASTPAHNLFLDMSPTFCLLVYKIGIVIPIPVSYSEDKIVK
jgi:hypothetical protein